MSAFALTQNTDLLEEKAAQLRELLIDVMQETGSGHIGGALGMTEMLTTLYFARMRHDPHNPNWSDRDYCVLSNGHTCPILYTTLASCGYFPTSELYTLRELNSRLQGHPHRGSIPGLETTSGPLGQGLSQAAGIAYSLKMDKKQNSVFTIMGDGEQQEGQNWEAYWFSGVNKLSNLTVMIDRNNIQIDGPTSSVLPLEPFADKLASFGWRVSSVDGHDFTALINATSQTKSDKPHAIICHTIPGKGAHFMEGDYHWHGKTPTPAEAIDAIAHIRAEASGRADERLEVELSNERSANE